MPTRRQQAAAAKAKSTDDGKVSDQVQPGEFKIPSRLRMRRAYSNASLESLLFPFGASLADSILLISAELHILLMYRQRYLLPGLWDTLPDRPLLRPSMKLGTREPNQ